MALDTTSQPDPLQLIPASQFTLDELTALYNQTRTDYIVPMPMNKVRMMEYIREHDVDLAHSYVASVEDHALGLAMLGVRPTHTWITRLGVTPQSRKHGAGRAMMVALLDSSRQLGIQTTVLEVIQNNTPAQRLFLDLGFKEVRELLVLRRPPEALQAPLLGTATWLDHAELLAQLQRRTDTPTWVTATESFARTSHTLLGLSLDIPTIGRGWLVVQLEQLNKYMAMLTHLIVQTEAGDAHQVGSALLAHLFNRYPDLDTQAENIPVNDPCCSALAAAGFIETFRRIEMVRRTEN